MIISVCLAVVLAAAPFSAQVRKTEVTKATTPADDGKGLSRDVPDSLTLSTRIDRIVLVRFKNQADLLAGLEKAVKDERIRNAVILGGVGSALAMQYHAVSNRTFPSKNVYVENPTAAADIVNVSGYVLNRKVHAHITFSGPDAAYGGHLEPRTRVFTFAIITLGVLPDDLDIARFDDKTWR